jgi:DNA-binding beta-propeller fold protein YncE
MSVGAVLVAALATVPVSSSARSARAAAGPGLAQLAGPDACYAQREEDSEAAALCRVGKGLIDAAAPVVSPDGSSVYVAASGSDSVAIFDRARTGALRETSCVSNNGTTGVDGTYRQCADGDAMKGATALAVSPDGHNVYLASYASSGIAIFSRLETGRLRQIGCVRGVATCTGARGLAGAAGLAVSPDGDNVYLAANEADAVTSFARDPATGKLKGLGCVSDDGTDRMCAKGNALRGADAVVVSPDGRFVYAAAYDSNSVLTFSRDPATGTLKQLGCALDAAPRPGSCTRAKGLSGPAALALAPDGQTLFVAAYDANAIAVFARNRATGALSERGCVSQQFKDESDDGCVQEAPLQGPPGVAVSPDGLRLYVSTDAGLTVLDRDRATGGLRPAGCVTYAGNEDDETKTCQIGRGVAGASGVAASPDGKNVYVSASESDAVAAFAPAVSMAVRGDAKARRLTVALACPVDRIVPCAGRVTLGRLRARARPFQLAPGSRSLVQIPLPPQLVAALRHRRRPFPLFVSASDTDRTPVLHRLMLTPQRHRR